MLVLMFPDVTSSFIYSSFLSCFICGTRSDTEHFLSRVSNMFDYVRTVASQGNQPIQRLSCIKMDTFSIIKKNLQVKENLILLFLLIVIVRSSMCEQEHKNNTCTFINLDYKTSRELYFTYFTYFVSLS